MNASHNLKMAAGVIAVGLGATAVLAQEQRAPAGMMDRDMMPMMGMMEQMSRMMESCNEMMEAARQDQRSPPAPAQPETQE